MVFGTKKKKGSGGGLKEEKLAKEDVRNCQRENNRLQNTKELTEKSLWGKVRAVKEKKEPGAKLGKEGGNL